MYLRVGKKKILLKDAKSFSKADILDILLSQLLVRRKRRSKGKVTRRERRLNKEDLRIFQEFEKMNKNQSKGSLKIPAKPTKDVKGMSFRDVLFYNAMSNFIKNLPKKNLDINIEVQKETEKEKKKQMKTASKVVPYVERIKTQPMPKFTDAEYEKLINELGFTRKKLDVTRQSAFFGLDLLNFEKKVNNKRALKMGLLKRWKENVEKKYNVRINANGRTSFTDYIVRIASAYPSAVSDPDFISDYSSMRDEIFSIPIISVPTVAEMPDVEEKEMKEGKEEDDDDDMPDLDFDADPRDTARVGHATHFTDGDDGDDDDNPEIAQAASAVLDQVASGAYYSGLGLSTDEIDDMVKPILKDMYLGTLPADFNKFLPKKLNGGRFGFVMNTDPSSKEGKHWVSVIIDLENDLSVEYFDSFGREPSKKFMKEIKKLIDKLKPHTYLKFKTSRVQVQDKNTQNCGFFAMKFLIDRLKNGMSFVDATGYKNDIVDDSVEGENKIKQLKNKFGYI